MSPSDSQNGQTELYSTRRALSLLALIVAGESIFFLPFVLPRIFRPTLLELFGLSNYELGTAFAWYGVVAMVAYALGGPLADYFSPRRLLATALITTSLGGALLWRTPSQGTLNMLYAYWGFTTIALFWAALIRATRQWGGKLSQGTAFGLLDGGRGLLTAVTGSCVVALYASLLPTDVQTASLEVRAHAFRQIIVVLACIPCFAAVLICWLLPKRIASKPNDAPAWSLAGTRRVAMMPTVWLQAVIIICAYVGFKATDDFSLYAKEVLQVDEVEAARVGTYSLWMRPLAAIAAGILADRFSAGIMTAVSFALLIAGSAVLASTLMSESMYVPYILTMVCASLGIFALRGLYYAIMEEGNVPLAYTGSAVGLVSVIGYTPDVFMGPLMGRLLDSSPGPPGHRHVFLVVMAFAVVGLTASALFLRATQSRRRAIS